MKITTASLLFAGLSGGLIACDSQVDPTYEGEVLFSLSGTVVIDNPDAPKNLVPALAYGASGDGKAAIRIEPVTFEGTFPANIRLKFFSPPSAEAFTHVYAKTLNREQAAARGEPRFALGYITAVTPETGRVLPVDNNYLIPSLCQGDVTDEPCTLDRARCPAGYVLEYGDDPDGMCFHEISECDRESVDAYGIPKTCTVVDAYGNTEYEKSGNPTFAGVSRNVAVLYLGEPAKAGTVTSRLLNRGRDVAAGYSLLRGRFFDDAELHASRACYMETLDGLVDGLEPAERTTPEGRYARARATLDEMEARGCSTAFVRYIDFEVVSDAGDAPIDIEISADASGFDMSKMFGGGS
jgi:hypothetical protein